MIDSYLKSLIVNINSNGTSQVLQYRIENLTDYEVECKYVFYNEFDKKRHNEVDDEYIVFDPMISRRSYEEYLNNVEFPLPPTPDCFLSYTSPFNKWDDILEDDDNLLGLHDKVKEGSLYYEDENVLLAVGKNSSGTYMIRKIK